MSLANGAAVELPPQPLQSTTTAKEPEESTTDAIAALKRKRSDTSALPVVNGDSAQTQVEEVVQDDIRGLIQDVKIILQK